MESGKRPTCLKSCNIKFWNKKGLCWKLNYWKLFNYKIYFMLILYLLPFDKGDGVNPQKGRMVSFWFQNWILNLLVGSIADFFN